MTTPLNKSWPIFAPINLSFDREKLKSEILNSGILEKGSIATSHKVDGKNFWDNKINFQNEKFKKLQDVPLWSDENKTELIKTNINTFCQVNLTTYDVDQITDMWEGKHENRSKIPLWIKNDFSWNFRSDVDLPYLQEVIRPLGLNYFSMIRIVYQMPPSIGLIHKDSGPKTNLDYYNQGGVGITLNVSSGGGNLYFIDSQGAEQSIDEENTPAWHFNDAALHCTDEIFSVRIQVRIYGNHNNYKSLMQDNKIY
jgi:hypothetical protein